MGIVIASDSEAIQGGLLRNLGLLRRYRSSQ
jgi:hypothetical protein